ncbi:TonB-dependent receptor (plasmid) [Ralstonia solanacearum]|nr:TonB-dependent receptor [Ralstonia solanacearum]
MPLRTPVCRAVLALAAAAPLSAFAAVDADAVGAAPAFVAQELAPTVAHAGTASAPFARNTPAVVQTVTADQLADRNLVTAEDALKYQPNVMVRRRFIGDRNAIFAGRDFNEIQSARGLLYADGILLSNLLGSSYGYPPRWSMVGPDDLARVDILYGPFSALLPGNSMGTTIALTLRKPEAFEAGAQTQVMRQHYSDAYGFSRNVTGNHESASLGDRIGRLWYALSVDRLENDSQPMQYATPNSVFTGGQASVPVTGAVRDLGPGGQPRVILGAQMLERTQQLQETLRLGYAFSERLEATLTLGHWENHFADRAESFLRDATPAAAGNVVTGGNVLIGGMPYTIAQNAFAPQNGDQENWLYGLGVKGRVGDWKLDANASAYDVTRDILRASNTATARAGPTSTSRRSRPRCRAIPSRPATTTTSTTCATGPSTRATGPPRRCRRSSPATRAIPARRPCSRRMPGPSRRAGWRRWGCVTKPGAPTTAGSATPAPRWATPDARKMPSRPRRRCNGRPRRTCCCACHTAARCASQPWPSCSRAASAATPSSTTTPTSSPSAPTTSTSPSSRR